MQRRADVYIELALIALRKLPRFLGEKDLEQYIADDYCQSAVERQLEVAGDVLGQLRRFAPDVFSRIPDGDLIVAFRNVLAHGYAVLDQHRVFEAATTKAPDLRAVLEHLLTEFPEQ